MKNFRKVPIVFIAGMIVFVSVNTGWTATFNVSNPSELQTAFSTAAANNQNDVINLSAGTYNLTATLTFNSLENYSLTVIGAGKGSTILHGGNARQIMSVITDKSNAAVLIRNMSFQNAASNGNGGALNVMTETASITIDNCEVADSTATSIGSIGGGASLTTDSGTITVISSEFLRNHSNGNVGGLYAGTSTGTCYITNCTFEENSVNNTGADEYFGDGGGVMFYSGEVGAGHAVIKGNTFRNNTASGGSNPDGGGLMTYQLGSGSTLTLENNAFTSNTAGLNGGGCILRYNNTLCTVIVSNNTFSNNQTFTGNGAGATIHMANGTLTYSDNIHTGNQAAKDGGGEGDGGGAWINIETGSATISGNTFASNQTLRNGGGMSAVTDTTEASISRNIFYSNTAGDVGGGLACATNSGTLNVFHNTTYENTASVDGGGMYLYMDQTGAQTSVKNNILWQDSPDEFGYSFGSGSATVVITCSCAWNSSGKSWFGTGCITDDPLFTDAAGGDFHLKWTNYPTSDTTKSPCIDTGDPASPDDTDNTRADMGALAYEQMTTIPGDVNSDSSVDLRDAILTLQVLSGITGLTVNLLADVNSNQKTDMAEEIYILQKVAGLR